MRWSCALAAVLLLVHTAASLIIEVGSTESRCVYDILTKDTLVTGAARG